MGKVVFVGAGPGDPGLITQKGILALKSAHVVLYDALAHPSLLAYCPAGALLIPVGKRKGEHLKNQTQIHRLLKKYAQQYPVVVRLKGGDPLLFGRGAEEMAFLRKNAFPYEIIPGVTSALAVPAYAGIPITHRSLSQSVAFVTGSPQKGKKSTDIFLPNADTLVILMGISQLETLIPRLILETQFRATTPVAVIAKGTLAAQKILISKLGTLKSDLENYRAQNGEFPTPAMIVVGNVVSQHQALAWVHELPLWGKRIVLLRDSELGQEWASHWASLGAEMVLFPMIEAKKLPQNIAKLTPDFLKPFTDIILTSPQGAQIFIESLLENNLDVRALHGKTITVIGKKTGDILRKYGLNPDRTAHISTSEGVVSVLGRAEIKTKKVLLPTAKGARPIIADAITSQGGKVTILSLYLSIRPKTGYFPITEGDIVVFTSGSTATHFYTHSDYKGQQIKACCIGPITEKTVRDYQKINIKTARTPTPDAILEILKEY